MLPRFLFFAFVVASLVVRAESTLNVADWTSRAGVRAVAVEFYATWCQPCMEAMPRWKTLREKYGRDGLRVVVVNTKDANGSCVNLGWKPDQTVCDLDGVLAERFGAGNLPAAFLWSWQGNLLVQSGHIDEVESAVEKLMREQPRVHIQADADLSPMLVAAVRQRLVDAGKVVVVADDADAAALEAMRRKQAASVALEGKCELGKQLAPNTVLKLKRINGGRSEYLSLELFDLERGCQQASTTTEWSDETLAMARDAVEALQVKLRRSELEWPRAQGTPAVTRNEGPVKGGIGTLELSSDVDGAQLTLDGFVRPGTIGPRQTTLELKSGDHRVRISKDGYLDELRTISVSGGRTTSVSAKLVADPKSSRIKSGLSNAAVVKVETKPTGAVVLVDGEARGRSPLEIDLPPGRHVLTARLNWYREASSTVTLDAGDSLGKNLELALDYGKLEINSAQRGVSVALEGQAQGVANPTLSRSPLSPGTYQLRASLADHSDYETTVQIVAGDTTRIEIPALRPTSGGLRVETSPPGAAIAVDGQARGVAPLLVERLAGGSHQLRVTLAGHGTVDQSVTVIEGQEGRIRLTLEPLMTPVTVTASPVAGRVTVDGRPAGNTPLQLDMAPGEHLVVVEPLVAGPHKLWQGRVTAVRGQPMTVAAVLAAAVGELVVSGTPTGAALRLDGRPMGNAPGTFASIPAGRHDLEVLADGYQPYRESFVTSADVRGTVKYTLKPVAIAPVAATAAPVDAEMVRAREAERKQVEAFEISRKGARDAADAMGGWSVTTGFLAMAAGGLWYFSSHVAEDMRSRYLLATTDFDTRYDTYALWGEIRNASLLTAGSMLAVSLGLAMGHMAALHNLPVTPTIEAGANGVGVGVKGAW